MSDLLAQDLSALRSVALGAGRTLLSRMDDVGPVSRKQATELVTAVDRDVEEMLLEALDLAFPGDRIEGEETGAHAGGSGRTWYVDPLDGTTNYAHGYPVFAVSLGCVDAEGLALAAVYAPYLDELYLAHRGGGAHLERPERGGGRALARRGAVALEDALLATGFPYVRDAEVDRATARVAAFLKAPCHGVRRAGSAAVDLVHVAAGKLDGYWETSLRPWDTAAGTLICREAGVLVTGHDGVADTLHDRDILAAAPGLHDQMRRVLALSAKGGAGG